MDNQIILDNLRIFTETNPYTPQSTTIDFYGGQLHKNVVFKKHTKVIKSYGWGFRWLINTFFDNPKSIKEIEGFLEEGERDNIDEKFITLDQAKEKYIIKNDMLYSRKGIEIRRPGSYYRFEFNDETFFYEAKEIIREYVKSNQNIKRNQNIKHIQNVK